MQERVARPVEVVVSELSSAFGKRTGVAGMRR